MFEHQVQQIKWNNTFLQTNMEAEHGVAGFRKATETMEAVSSQKAEIDNQKGETLEDMSQMVMELNRKIGERKNRLAPIIKGELLHCLHKNSLSWKVSSFWVCQNKLFFKQSLHWPPPSPLLPRV